jgi:hypothetical protein
MALRDVMALRQVWLTVMPPAIPGAPRTPARGPGVPGAAAMVVTRP